MIYVYIIYLLEIYLRCFLHIFDVKPKVSNLLRNDIEFSKI